MNNLLDGFINLLDSFLPEPVDFVFAKLVEIAVADCQVSISKRPAVHASAKMHRDPRTELPCALRPMRFLAITRYQALVDVIGIRGICLALRVHLRGNRIILRVKEPAEIF